MILAGFFISAPSGYGSDAGGVTHPVTFSPQGGSYAGESRDVTVTVEGAATQFSWQIDDGAITVVADTSGVITVPLSIEGSTLNIVAMDDQSVVLTTTSAKYYRDDASS